MGAGRSGSWEAGIGSRGRLHMMGIVAGEIVAETRIGPSVLYGILRDYRGECRPCALSRPVARPVRFGGGFRRIQGSVSGGRPFGPVRDSLVRRGGTGLDRWPDCISSHEDMHRYPPLLTSTMWQWGGATLAGKPTIFFPSSLIPRPPQRFRWREAGKGLGEGTREKTRPILCYRRVVIRSKNAASRFLSLAFSTSCSDFSTNFAGAVSPFQPPNAR